MTTAYTSLLGLALPVTGELSGTWGDTVNNSITSLLDSAIAGTTTLSSDADVTLTTTTGASNTSRQAIILWTAGGTVTRNITAPAQSKIYTVINKSSSTQSIVLRGAGPTTGVTIVQGESAVCAWNGSDFIKISNTSGAGVFTTLSVSGAVTLSGGTANGVAYLNGSKVLTTGSALTFNGTDFATTGKVASGSTGAAGRFDLARASDGGVVVALGLSGNDFSANNGASGSYIFNINSSEALRLTSTSLYTASGINVGIGLSNPAVTLDMLGTYVQGGSSRTNNATKVSSYRVANYANATNPLNVIAGLSTSGTNNVYIGGNDTNFAGTAATSILFYTGASNTTESGTLRATIDSSGNLGIGTGSTTPGARLDLLSTTSGMVARFKSTGAYASVVADNTGTTGGGAFSARQNGTTLALFGVSGYIEGNTTTDAFVFAESGGSIKFYTNGSPAAKVTIDTGGAIVGATSLSLTAASGYPVYFNTGSTNVGRFSSNVNGIFTVGNQDSVGALGTDYATIGAWGSAGGGLRIYRGTGAGTSIATIYADASALSINADTSSPIIFNINGSERARIDSSGNLLVGAGITSSINGTFCPIQALNNTANQVAYFRNSNANPSGTIVNYSGASPNNTGNEFVYCSDSTAQRASFRSNGGVANYSANNVNLSDRREKTNFAPAKSYLDVICSIPVQTFNYIDQNLEEDGGLTLGVVAQDVQAVAPELVMDSDWGTEENPKMRLSIYQTDLQYALMKALQELKAEFDAYKASHP